MGRPSKNLEIPSNYKPSDIPLIIKLLETKTGHEVAKLFGVTTEEFKSHISILRSMGYPIPRVSYLLSKGRPLKPPKPEPVRLPDKIVDPTKMKWVRIDKRTTIQVPIETSEEEAIEQYYTKKDRINNFKNH